VSGVGSDRQCSVRPNLVGLRLFVFDVAPCKYVHSVDELLVEWPRRCYVTNAECQCYKLLISDSYFHSLAVDLG